MTRPGAQRSTSSAGQASPPSSSATDSRPLRGERRDRRRGLGEHVDVFGDQQGVEVSAVSSATCSGTTTRRPPPSRAAQISQTEKSKA